MTVQTIKFARKPFYVDAIQVTKANMTEVAEWCGGTIHTETSRKEGTADINYVAVRVHNPLTPRQSKAYIGDWILYAGTGYKVYTPKAFTSCFDEVQGAIADAMIQAGKLQVEDLKEIEDLEKAEVAAGGISEFL